MEGKFLNDDKFLPEPCVILHEKPYTYATCHFIEFCQILWPLVRYLLCFDDQVHVHISTIHSMYLKVTLSKISRNMGYTKIDRIKYVHQKGVPWEKRSMIQRRHGKKDASTQWRHATCTSMNIKKRKRISVRKNIAHIKRERRGVSLGEKSYPTHMHYLIKRVQLVFIFGSNLWLSDIWGISMPIHIPKTPYISLLELGKSL